MPAFKTALPPVNEIPRTWWLVDADGLTLGRLASEVAHRLRGKHKAIYTPHLDTGDYIIVINAEKVLVSGRKEDNKIYRKGMLPKGALGRQMYRKLHVYAGPDHKHAAQKPQPLDIPQARRAVS